MKKVFSLILLATSLFCLTSCSSKNDIYIPQEVDLTLDYLFIESGSMTRATGEGVYKEFYEKYIKTKQLTPKTYHLEFIKSDESVLTISGEWGINNNIRLTEGEYIVTGYSYPKEEYAKQPKYLPSDTAYIIFDEKVSITKDMTSLILNAKYDSFLLLFDKANKTDIILNIDERKLNHDDSCYWVFGKDKSWTNYDNGFSFTHYLSANILMNNPNNILIELGKLPLNKGKYYYFNDLTTSFDVPQMESGN